MTYDRRKKARKNNLVLSYATRLYNLLEDGLKVRAVNSLAYEIRDKGKVLERLGVNLQGVGKSLLREPTDSESVKHLIGRLDSLSRDLDT